MIKCPICKSQMVWQSDWDFEDVGREGSGVESLHICSNDNCKSEFRYVTENKEVKDNV